MFPVFRQIPLLPTNDWERRTVRTIETCSTNDGVQVKVSSVDQIDTSLSHSVNFTGDDGDVGLKQRLEIAISWGKPESASVYQGITVNSPPNLPSAANMEFRNQFTAQFLVPT